jgi:hypothetical protein
MGNLILILSFALPIAVAIFVVVWVLGKPARELRRLEARAAAGDAQAQAELDRMKQTERAMMRGVGARDPDHERLLSQGLSERAVIVDVRSTGIHLGDEAERLRVVEVDLQIEGVPGKVTVRDAVSELHFGRLLKGENVPVRVDPVDRTRVAVEWDRR